MFDDLPDDEPIEIEAFLRAGGECPVLSRGLCERIVAQAVPARAGVVRRRRRGHAGVVLGLSLALAFFVDRLPSLSPARLGLHPFSLTIAISDDIPNRHTTGIAAVPVGDADDENWNQVERMSQVRRRQFDLLRSAFAA